MFYVRLEARSSRIELESARLVEGEGPSEGWITWRTAGKDLAVRPDPFLGLLGLEEHSFGLKAGGISAV